MNLLEILQGCNVALNVLQARLVLMVTLLLTFTLFCWAMWMQTQLAAIIAAGWACLVFLPVLYTGGKHGIEARREPATDAGSGTAPRSAQVGATGRAA